MVSHSQPPSPQETFKDLQVVLAYAPMGVTALPWVPVHVKTCACPARVESLFPPVLWSSCTQAPLTSKAKCSGGSSSQCQTPRLGSLKWGSELSLLWENLCDIIISSLWVAHLASMGFDYIVNVLLLPSCCDFFFVFGCRISFLVGSSLFCRQSFSSQL